MFAFRPLGATICTSALLLLILADDAAAGNALAARFRAGARVWLEKSDNPSLALPAFTLEFWIRARGSGIIASRKARKDTSSDWRLSYDRERSRILLLMSRGKPVDSLCTQDGVLPPGVWHHLAMTVNGADGIARLSIDGRPVWSARFAPRRFDVRAGFALGGCFGDASAANVDCDLAELRYWAGERSGERILRYFDKPLPQSERAGLQGYWRLFGNYADSSGLSNTLTAYGNVLLVPVRDLPAELGFDGAGAPEIIPMDATSFCAGGQVRFVMKYNGHGHYFAPFWSTGERNQSITVKDSGDYFAAVVDYLTGRAAFSPVVTVNRLPMPPIPVFRVSHDSLMVDSRQPCRWYRNDTRLDGESGSSISLSKYGPGIYRVEVTNEAGCTASGSVFAPRMPAVVDPNGVLMLCMKDSLILDAGEGYVSYLWSDGSGKRTLAVKAGGSYRVIVADAFGRRDTSAPVVVESRLNPPPPRLWMAHDTLFTDAGYAYRWRYGASELPHAAAEFLVPSRTGWYSVEISDTYGCRASSSCVVRASTVISLHRETGSAAEAGAIVHVSIRMEESSLLSGSSSDSCRYSIAYDPRRLLPCPGGSPEIAHGRGTDTLRAKGARPPGMVRGPLLDLPFEVISADTPFVTISLASFRWNDTLKTALLAETGCEIPLRDPTSAPPADPAVRMFRNYPNPAAVGTTFEVDLAEETPCSLLLYDGRGRPVGSLVDRVLARGRHRFWCDARSLSPGMYIARLETSRGRTHRSLVLLPR